MSLHDGPLDEIPGKLETTKRSFVLLETIQEMDGARASELIERFDLAKSTIYAHLSTLEELGYLTREGDTYYVGLIFRSLADAAENRKELYQLAEERTQQLASETKAEVLFSVEENGRAMAIHRNTKHSLNRDHERRSVSKMHASSVGKAMLAELPMNRVDDIIDRWGLVGQTPHTITSREELLPELEKISERGYAINDEETREGFRAVGVAVCYPNGEPAGAISLSGPKYYLEDDVIPELAGIIQEEVHKLEEEIDSLAVGRQ